MKRVALALAWVSLIGCEDPPPQHGDAPKPASAASPAPRRDDDDVLARAAQAPGQVAGQPAAPKPPGARLPEQLFRDVGCVACHGPSAAFHKKIVDARGKPEAEIAAWILHPEKVKPTTAMPTFANVVTPDEALALARWIKAGNPPP